MDMLNIQLAALWILLKPKQVIYLNQDVPLEEGKKIIDQCISSMQERFVMSQTSFTVKVITKNGIEIIR